MASAAASADMPKQTVRYLSLSDTLEQLVTVICLEKTKVMLPERFELSISRLLSERLSQLGHGSSAESTVIDERRSGAKKPKFGRI